MEFARVVTRNYSKWDRHGGANNSIFQREREDFPFLDNAFATLYKCLGLDASHATVNDLSGRPQYLVADQAKPLPELI